MGIKFKADQRDLKDAACLGRPRTTTTKSNVKKITGCSIHRKVSSTIGELFLYTSSWHFRKTHLKFRKINARWIPHLPTDEQKRYRVLIANKLLKMFLQYSKNLSII